MSRAALVMEQKFGKTWWKNKDHHPYQTAKVSTAAAAAASVPIIATAGTSNESLQQKEQRLQMWEAQLQQREQYLAAAEQHLASAEEQWMQFLAYQQQQQHLQYEQWLWTQQQQAHALPQAVPAAFTRPGPAQTQKTQAQTQASKN